MLQELMMDTRLVWDPLSIKQIEEAKSRYLTFKKQGYLITKGDGTPLSSFKASLGELVVHAKKTSQKVLKILCDKGDERIVWDKDNGKQAKEAKVKFEEKLAAGYIAFSTSEKGEKKVKIDEFDVEAEEIILIPPTSKG